MCTTFGAVVLTSIQFDGMPQFCTVEIEGVRPNRMLPTELSTVHPAVAKTRPQQCFGIRRFLPLFAGKLDEFESLACDLMMDLSQPRKHGRA